MTKSSMIQSELLIPSRNNPTDLPLRTPRRCRLSRLLLLPNLLQGLPFPHHPLQLRFRLPIFLHLVRFRHPRKLVHLPPFPLQQTKYLRHIRPWFHWWQSFLAQPTFRSLHLRLRFLPWVLLIMKNLEGEIVNLWEKLYNWTVTQAVWWSYTRDNQ